MCQSLWHEISKYGSCILLFRNQDTDLKALRASKLAFVMTFSIYCDF